jgi:dihydroneopterin aldolase
VNARLELRGIRASGRHGARPGEKDAPQPFVVDLALELGVAEDRLGATADYRGLVERVRRVVEEGSFDLIETLADRIAEAVIQTPPVRRVRVAVHKPNAARRLGVDDVVAVAERDEP